MKKLNTTLTASEIRNLKLNENDVLGFDYQYENGVDNHYLLLNGNRLISFTKQANRKKSFDKIKKMGFGLGYSIPKLTDEEEGLIQANEIGENPFSCTIMS